MNVGVGVGVGMDVRAYVHACVVATMMCCDVEYRSSALRISQGPIEVATYVCRYRRMYVRRECERRAWMPASPELSLFRRTDQISGRHGRGREGGGGGAWPQLQDQTGGRRSFACTDGVHSR